MRKIYLTIFVLFFRLGAGQWPASFNADAHKGVAGVSIITAMLIVSMMFWLEWWTGYALPSNSWQLWGVVSLPFILNHYFLLTKEYGLSFESKFDSLEKGERVFLYSLAIGTVLSVLAIVYLTALINRRKLDID